MSAGAVVIVTGLSGAGNSTALKALADAGMYCIDNLPIELIEPTIDLMQSGRISAEHGLALCMDVRDRSFSGKFPEIQRTLAQRVRVQTIFLTADSPVLVTRFGATRRRHPLLRNGETLTEAIEREREILGFVEECADVVFDTSTWNPQQLVRAVESRLSMDLPPRQLNVTITSFGFKYGQLQPVDMMFDLRFLDNPYFVPELKTKSGLDTAVSSYILKQPEAQVMLSKIEELMTFLLPLYHKEGKHYLRLGVGCTGGRHRSVCFAETIGARFLAAGHEDVVMTILHRDIDR
ncbi:MAG: RNase adapter RapZ [Deltaproteobacteria bacterium]|nr:RNase adapter RapZ [Deltaproteobacteria bacterium]